MHRGLRLSLLAGAVLLLAACASTPPRMAPQSTQAMLSNDVLFRAISLVYAFSFELRRGKPHTVLVHE